MAPRLHNFAEMAGRVAVALQGAPPGVPQRVWAQLGPWVRQFLVNATGKWLPRITAELPCQVPNYRKGVLLGSCDQYAVAVCDVCGSLACLHHCRVDKMGDAICYRCIMNAMQQRDAAGAPPPPNRGQSEWDQTARAGGDDPDEGWRPAPASAEQAALRAAYGMLGVRPSASEEQLKSALKRKLARWHPDRFKTEGKKREAEGKFKEIQAAYEVIRIARERNKAAA